MNRGTLLIIAVLCVSVKALNSFCDRVAVVTGASSGIGKAIAIALVKKGMNVVGIDIQYELLQNLSNSLEGESGKLYARRCDVRVEDDVVSTFQWIDDNLGGAIAVLVNSAGVAIKGSIAVGNLNYWRNTLDTNVLGLSICTKEAVNRMLSHGVADSQIIHIGSTYGYFFVDQQDSDLYSASEYAISSLTQSFRKEMTRRNGTTRVTCIMPGTVDTPLLTNPDFFMPPEEVEPKPKLLAEDVAAAACYVLSTSSRTQIVNLVMVPTGEDI